MARVIAEYYHNANIFQRPEEFLSKPGQLL